MTAPTTSRSDKTGGGRADEIYDVLRLRITSGEIQPGEVLTEVALATEFGVSRTPIRDALKFLVWEGLVDRRGRDLRVRTLDPEEIADIYDVRIVLEQLAARLAATRRTEFDLAHLRHKLEAMQQLDPEAVDERPAAAYELHFAIWRAAHNRELGESLRRLQAVVEHSPSSTLHYPQRWAEMLEQCRELVEAIALRDAERAEAAARLQMEQARDVRLQLYTSGLEPTVVAPPAPRSGGRRAGSRARG